MSDITVTSQSIENRWATISPPTTPEGWLQRAEEVSDILAVNSSVITTSGRGRHGSSPLTIRSLPSKSFTPRTTSSSAVR